MSDVSDSETPVVMESEPKKKKGKKRPSDFEIVRTILQRSHERKLPYLLKNMGENPDILFFCSQDESQFTYGSPDLAIAIYEFSDPELSAMVETCLKKLYGLRDGHNHQLIINVRDQISELSKSKGESINVDVCENEFGSAWVIRKDVNGKERTQPFATAIDSLFHMQLVKSWCDSYRPLLDTQNNDYLYYPYVHPEGETGSLLKLPAGDPSHKLTQYYPHGFRTMATRGLDVIIDKALEGLPYPVIQEDMIVFQDQSVSCQMAHRVIAEGWKMILLRPNAVFFPTLTTSLPSSGLHSL